MSRCTCGEPDSPACAIHDAVVVVPGPDPITPEVRAVLDTQGFWLCTDSKFPDAIVLIVSRLGVIYSTTLDSQLDPAKFTATVHFELLKKMP